MATHQQTPSDFPAPGDEKSQISEVTKPLANDVQQASIAQETAKQDSLPSVFKNSEPIREDQIQNAIKFLSHPRVRGSPVIHRRSFLERKGLTKEEIDEAFRRVPDPPPSSQTNVNSQDGQQAVSNVQPQGQIQAMQPAPAPVVMIPPPSFLSRFRWYHAALAVGVLAASGAGTAVFVKKSLIPRLKSWVRRIMLEEETDPQKKADAKPSLAEEAVAAAKAASAAASDVARVSQEMMKTKSEEKKYFEDLMHVLGVQVQEMKSLSNNIRSLEGKSNNLPKLYSADQEVYGGSITTPAARKPYANGSNVDYDTRSARSASPPAPADSSMPPHPKSYMDIMSMIQRGEKPSNIREINDMPPNPNQQLSNPRIAPKTKPWDYGQAPQDDSSNGSWWQQKTPRSTDFGYETTASRSIGIQNETNTMEPAALQRQRSWVPPQPPPVVMPEAAEAIRRPKPQAKIDQDAAASDDQSGVSDELQKITKFSESGGDGSGRLQVTEIQEETEQQQISQEGN
ncbi:hypothetical protein EUTSA_v10004017mg [Eutrema salsugineum]|uniref:Peroxisomal membrane protein PEX14 n=1 Tax=Eutrema salsugineum TaxID=72664 RepID=V4K175_EUTSA|nr:peroxisomal membrane protein PEX14 isoform X2 [Eutrema salsugineum]ESQ31635.1 hypothetical protein EUTSA_v10004017mg [Eutrema salsugineum]